VSCPVAATAHRGLCSANCCALLTCLGAAASSENLGRAAFLSPPVCALTKGFTGASGEGGEKREGALAGLLFSFKGESPGALAPPAALLLLLLLLPLLLLACAANTLDSTCWYLPWEGSLKGLAASASRALR
jgi:hypothetical protein